MAIRPIPKDDMLIASEYKKMWTGFSPHLRTLLDEGINLGKIPATSGVRRMAKYTTKGFAFGPTPSEESLDFLSAIGDKEAMPKIQKELKEWQIFQAVMKDPSIRRVLLYGPPGTGKTTAAVKSSGAKRHYNLTLHEESSVAELIGHWVPKGSEFLFHHGPLTKSWTEGALFVANEIDHSCGAVLSILLAALDDDGVAHLDLPTGETVKPTKDFRFIATMNGNPSDLPEPLIDRFDIMLKISTPSIPAIDALPKDLRHLCRNAYSNRNDLHITYRQIQALTKLRAIISLDDALNTVFGLKKAKDIKMVIKAGERNEAKIK